MARVVLLLLLLVAPVWSERHEDRFWTIELPAGWQPGRDATGAFFRATPATPQPNVWIMVVHARLQGTLADYLQRSRTVWELSSRVTTEPDGTIVLVNPAARQWKLLREHQGAVYVVTCTAPAGAYAEWEPQYRSVLASFAPRQPATDVASFRAAVEPLAQALLALPRGSAVSAEAVSALRERHMALRLDWDATSWNAHPAYVLLSATVDALADADFAAHDPATKPQVGKYWAEFLQKREQLRQALTEVK
jgi:hypothetical protein